MASKKRTREQVDSTETSDRSKVAIFPFPAGTTEAEIRKFLSPLGTISTLSVAPAFAKYTGKPTGLRADVKYDNFDTVRAVRKALRSTKFNEKALQLSFDLGPKQSELKTPTAQLALSFPSEVDLEKLKTALKKQKSVSHGRFYSSHSYVAKFETVEDATAALKAFPGSIAGVKAEFVNYLQKSEKKAKKAKPQQPQPKKAKTVATPVAKPVAKPAAAPKKEAAKAKAAPKKEGADAPKKENAKAKVTPAAAPKKEVAKAKATPAAAPKKEVAKAKAKAAPKKA
jgi:RNA recognition motif-containing protein